MLDGPNVPYGILGGLVVYVKDNVCLELCDTDSEDIIWLKWDKAHSLLDCDIFFCICYIPPATSPRHVDVEGDLLD